MPHSGNLATWAVDARAKRRRRHHGTLFRFRLLYGKYDYIYLKVNVQQALCLLFRCNYATVTQGVRQRLNRLEHMKQLSEELSITATDDVEEEVRTGHLAL